MTNFRFRLQRVLDLRETQFQIAESAYRITRAKLQSVQAEQAALASRKLETRKAFARLPEIAGRDLAALPDWYRWTVTTHDTLVRHERAITQELEKRRQALIEAQRKVRLLEKLRDRRKAEWQTAADQEIEALAADSVNTRYAMATDKHR